MDLKINSKIDTGAKISSIYGKNVAVDTNNNTVTFGITNIKGQTRILTTPIIQYLEIMNSFGETEKRIVVKLKVHFGKYGITESLFGISNREKLRFPVLIGLLSIPNDVLINPHIKNTIKYETKNLKNGKI